MIRQIRLNIWKYVKNYKFNSFFVRYFLLIFLLIIIPMSSISLGVYQYLNGLVMSGIKDSVSSEMERAKENIDIVLSLTDNYILRLATDSNVFLYMVTDFADLYQEVSETDSQSVSQSDVQADSQPGTKNDSQVNTQTDTKDGLIDSAMKSGNSSVYINYLEQGLFKISERIKEHTLVNEYISSIYVYSQYNGYVISTPNGFQKIEKFYDVNWKSYFESRIGSSDMGVIVRSNPINNQESIITLIRWVYSPINECLGAIIVNLDSSKILELLQSQGNTKLTRFSITINNYKYLIEFDLKKSTASRIIKNSKNEGSEYLGVSKIDFKNKLNGESIVTTKIQSSHNSVFYQGYISMNYYITRMDVLKNVVFVLIIISFLLGVALAYYLSYQAFKPLVNLISIIEHPEKWSSFIKDKTKLNEVKYITMNIMKTFSDNTLLEEELGKRLVMLKEAQNVALQSQINPHFLFNTLETIKWMVFELTNSNNVATKALDSLARLLQSGLKTKSPVVLLLEEVEHAKRYIEIQKLRYGDKFNVIWNTPNEVMEISVLKLMLQPLIENSIYHGIKPKAGKCNIKINAFIYKETFIIEVEDDGIGIKEEKLIEINSLILQDDVPDDHIGLRNVNQRIKLIFGENYGITIESVFEKGSKVKICLPKSLPK